ncbi:MAG: hypothetical protein A2050_15040 [Candidatus Rokubacteria bacterium GWA2_73_35]|nr:MAG: hypothetical protein A2050_15040 [Candidatus Rokubacteria bacterium GWA2_73_35]
MRLTLPSAESRLTFCWITLTAAPVMPVTMATCPPGLDFDSAKKSMSPRCGGSTLLPLMKRSSVM